MSTTMNGVVELRMGGALEPLSCDVVSVDCDVVTDSFDEVENNLRGEDERVITDEEAVMLANDITHSLMEGGMMGELRDENVEGAGGGEGIGEGGKEERGM